VAQVLERLRPLTHGNIVHYKGKLEDPEGIVLVMEYCSGTITPISH
jgi:serine/threonine protein kinase